jgi:hypothetical protein
VLSAAGKPGSISRSSPTTPPLVTPAAVVQPLGMGSQNFRGSPKVGEARKLPRKILEQPLRPFESTSVVAGEESLSPPVLSEGFRRIRIVQEDEISEDSFGIQSEAKPFLCIDGASSVQETVCTGGSSSSVLESKLESTTGQIFKVLYLFTCRKRKAEVWWYLQKLCVRHRIAACLL